MESQTKTSEKVMQGMSNTDFERSEIIERFGPYRKPTEATIPRYKAIQEKCLELAMLIHELCPSSKQKSIALSNLEACKMSANAAIAIHMTPNESVGGQNA